MYSPLQYHKGWFHCPKNHLCPTGILKREFESLILKSSERRIKT
jgi:hypothetical protein